MEEKRFVRFKINKGGFDSLQEAINFLESEQIPFKTNGANPKIWESIIIITDVSCAEEMEKIIKDKGMFVERSEPTLSSFVRA